jgi:hypothetical protein
MSTRLHDTLLKGTSSSTATHRGALTSSSHRLSLFCTSKQSVSELDRALARLHTFSAPLHPAYNELESARNELDRALAMISPTNLSLALPAYAHLAKLHQDCLEADTAQRNESVMFVFRALEPGGMYSPDDPIFISLANLIKNLVVEWTYRDLTPLVTETVVLYPLLCVIFAHQMPEEHRATRLRILTRLGFSPHLGNDNPFHKTVQRQHLTPPFSRFLDVLDRLHSIPAFRENPSLGPPLVGFERARRRLAKLEDEAIAVVLDVVILRAERERWVRRIRERQEREREDRL